MDFFHPSFSLIFLHHFHHPFHLAIWFQLFACLIRAAIFHLTRICVDLSFFIILPQASFLAFWGGGGEGAQVFAFGFFLCLFSACFGF